MATGKAHGQESADRGYLSRRVRGGLGEDEPEVLPGGGDCASKRGNGIDFLWRSQQWLRYRERKFDVVGRVSHWQ